MKALHGLDKRVDQTLVDTSWQCYLRQDATAWAATIKPCLVEKAGSPRNNCNRRVGGCCGWIVHLPAFCHLHLHLLLLLRTINPNPVDATTWFACMDTGRTLRIPRARSPRLLVARMSHGIQDVWVRKKFHSQAAAKAYKVGTNKPLFFETRFPCAILAR